MLNKKFIHIDERRELFIPGEEKITVQIAASYFVALCQSAVEDHGYFSVALSGGSTPKTLYNALTSPPYRDHIPWDKLYLFWSDERAVSPDDPESNYRMTLDAGFGKMGIPPSHIFRMVAETDIEQNAAKYEEKLKSFFPLDLVLLGMGDDGHTASLFPGTDALLEETRLVVPNFVPQKKSWRMTLTFEAINSSRNILVYVLGEGKSETIYQIFRSKNIYPIQKIGTEKQKALWILDKAAAKKLLDEI